MSHAVRFAEEKTIFIQDLTKATPATTLEQTDRKILNLISFKNFLLPLGLLLAGSGASVGLFAGLSLLSISLAVSGVLLASFAFTYRHRYDLKEIAYYKIDPDLRLALFRRHEYSRGFFDELFYQDERFDLFRQKKISLADAKNLFSAEDRYWLVRDEKFAIADEAASGLLTKKEKLKKAKTDKLTAGKTKTPIEMIVAGWKPQTGAG